jgi:hypothetical protein
MSCILILVADHQLHHLYGKPGRFFRTADADRLVQSAFRPTDDFSQRCAL